MNRTLEAWAAVKPDAVVGGSTTQARNVIEMMQQDIAALGRQIEKSSAEFAHALAEKQESVLLLEETIKKAKADLNKIPAMIRAVAAEADADHAVLKARVSQLEAPFRFADAKDWEHLDLLLGQSGHGKFWRAVFTELRPALEKVAP